MQAPRILRVKKFTFIEQKQYKLTQIAYYLNDLWRYRVNDSTWTWMSGSNFTNQPGVYGEKGKASIEYAPGARCCAVGWFDSVRQEFWLFSGEGYDQQGKYGA